MAPGSVFGRDEDEAPAGETSEGVRLIGADEAAEAAERGDTARRRGRDEKKYGDRPEPPSPDVKPAIRFPLADSADASELERPRPAPVTPRTADDAGEGRPMLSVGPPTGESQLPHWTEPGTGEVPRVIIGDDVADDDAERWQAFASSSPRWRDTETDWNREEDSIADLVHDDDTRIGALDERDRMSDEDYLTFDDLDVPDAELPSAPPRGTAADPIKIRASGARPAPAPSGRVAPPRAARTAGDDAGTGGPAGGGRDREQAIQVGGVIAGVALVAFLIGGKLWQPFMLVIVVPILVAATAEFFTAARKAGFKPVHLVGLVAAGAMPLAAYAGGESGTALVLFLAFALTAGLFLLREVPGRPVANLAVTVGGLVYIGVLGSYAALLLRAGPWANKAVESPVVAQGNSYLFLVAVGTVLHDIAGYLVGSKIGKRPLSKASPNKTVEGLAVAMGAAFASILVLGGLLHIGVQNLGQALLLGLLVAVAAPFGDLVESMVKRDLGIKDMGDVLPSHGGVLDRFDAFLFTLPVAYYVLKVLGLIA